ncbi:hypothetical protein [Thiomonas sp.]
MAALKRGPQEGYVLLLTLITLLVLLFGILFTMRGTLLQTEMTGNTIQRQKDVQAGDLALRQVQQALIATVQGAGSPLDVAASGQPWFYTPTVTSSTLASTVPGAAGPYSNFWTNCSANNQCAPLSSMVSALNPAPPAINDASGQPYQVLISVWPTNQPTNPYACGTTGFTASYYAVFLHITEASGSTAINTQSVIKLCTT